MTNQDRIDAYKIRIELLSSRKKASNANIINKLKRKVRKLENMN